MTNIVLEPLNDGEKRTKVPFVGISPSKWWEAEVEKYDDEVEEIYDMRGEYKCCPSCGGAPAERIERVVERVPSAYRY